jgi:hypothetical protein
MWKFKKIKGNDIQHFTNLYLEKNLIQDAGLKKYNIFYGDYQNSDGLRHDAVWRNKDRIKGMARLNPDKVFLAILDQGEHDAGSTHPIDNYHFFNRRFNAACCKFNGSSPPKIPHDQRQNWLWCPMGRADHIRTRFFDIMVDLDLHHAGRISYLATNFPERQIDPVQYLRTGGTDNYGMIPYSTIDDGMPANQLRLIPVWNKMQDCLIGIDVEVGAVDPQPWYTERLYYILAAGLAPVVISGPGSMGKLESMGFHMPNFLDWRLSDGWKVDDWGTGVDKISHILQDIANLIKRDKLAAISRDWQPYAEHNWHQWLEHLPDLYRREEGVICKWVMTLTDTLSRPDLQHLLE